MISDSDAGIAQLVEHDLAKVGVASSSLVSRSSFRQGPVLGALLFQAPMRERGWNMKESGSRDSSHRPGGRVVMQRTANPRTPVQFRPRPPEKTSPTERSGFFFGDADGAFQRARRRRVSYARARSSPDGGTGRRSGLKIRRPRGRPGSIPGPGTNRFK